MMEFIRIRKLNNAAQSKMLLVSPNACYISPNLVKHIRMKGAESQAYVPTIKMTQITSSWTKDNILIKLSVYSYFNNKSTDLTFRISLFLLSLISILLILYGSFYKFINTINVMYRSAIRQARIHHLNYSIENLQSTWKQFKRNRTKQERLGCISSKKKIQINVKLQQQNFKKQKIKIVLTPKKKSQIKERNEKKFQTNSRAQFLQQSNLQQDRKVVKIMKPRQDKMVWTVRQGKRENQKQYMQIQDIIRKSLATY